MHTALDHLKACPDSQALRTALDALCTPYGPIARLDILPTFQAGRQQALCFLRLHSDEQEQLIMDRLGFGRFGGEIVIVVELHTRWKSDSASDRQFSLIRPQPTAQPAHAQHPVHLGHAP
jgi:hypothetical protein